MAQEQSYAQNLEMSCSEADAAYDAYMQERFFEELREEIAQELKDGTLDRIREKSLDVSRAYRQIVQNSIQQSNALRLLNPPDYLGAFFHTYRAIDAYLDVVVMRPMLDVVIEPVARLFKPESLAPFNVWQLRFSKNVRDQLLRALCFDEASAEALKSLIAQFDGLAPLRNKSFHGFESPNQEDAIRCEKLADEITALIEVERLKVRRT